MLTWLYRHWRALLLVTLVLTGLGVLGALTQPHKWHLKRPTRVACSIASGPGAGHGHPGAVERKCRRTWHGRKGRRTTSGPQLPLDAWAQPGEASHIGHDDGNVRGREP